MRALLAAALVASVAVAAARAAPDEPTVPATRRYASGDEGHGVAVELPREWKVERLDVPPSLMFLRLKSANVDGFFSLVVFRNPAVRNERGQAMGERSTMPKACQTDVVGEVHLDPMPHLVMDYQDHGDMLRHVWVYRVINRLGLTVNVGCAIKSWPSIRDAVFRAAATMTSDFDEWPARPEGYVPSLRDGFEYLAHPAVKGKEVDALHAAVLEQEKRYVVLHGGVPKPAANPIVVVVTPDAQSAAALSPAAASRFGYAASWQEGRLFATPLRRDDVAGRAELADRLALIFHVQSYGCGEPMWLSDGERRVAAVEAWTHKPLPAVSSEHMNEFATSLAPLAELVRQPPKDAVAQSASYVALFRAGPKPYRDAFSAFLQDLATTGDWEAAQEAHLFSLDQEKLRAAAQVFVSKELRPVKAK